MPFLGACQDESIIYLKQTSYSSATETKRNIGT